MQTIQGQDQNLALLRFAAENNLPVLLVGDTGTGKTSSVEELARASDKPLYRINLNGQTGTDEIIGKYLLKDRETQWTDGALTMAMKSGSWILLDEINAASPEVLFTLHSLLDHDRMIALVEKNNEVVKPHPNFRIFASMNAPSAEYSGVKDMNAAFVSRFPIVLTFNYPNQETEARILQERENKLTTSDAIVLTELASRLRTLRGEGKVMYVCSTRDLLNAALLLCRGYSIVEAVSTAILNKVFDQEEKKLITDTFVAIAKTALPEPESKKSITEIVKENADLREKSEKMEKDYTTKMAMLDEITAKLTVKRKKKTRKRPPF